MPELEPAQSDVLSLIGNTPLVRASRIDTGPCELYLKLENQNPGGSIKDRIGLSMIEAAEKSGAIFCRQGCEHRISTQGRFWFTNLLAEASKAAACFSGKSQNLSSQRDWIGASLPVTPQCCYPFLHSRLRRFNPMYGPSPLLSRAPFLRLLAIDSLWHCDFHSPSGSDVSQGIPIVCSGPRNHRDTGSMWRNPTKPIVRDGHSGYRFERPA